MPQQTFIPVPHTFPLSNVSAARQAFWILTFAVATGIAAQIEIPHKPVPYTLQTFVVLLSGMVLGKRNAFLSMLAYLGLGMAGLPLFSGGGFGLAKIAGPTGGYLLAFPLAAYLVGALAGSGPGYGRILASMVTALVVIFSLGTIHLNVFWLHDWWASVSAGFLIFSWWDVVKLLAASSIAHQYIRRFSPSRPG